MVHVTPRSARTGLSLALTASLIVAAVSVAAPASAARPAPPAPSTSTGYGGAVASVDAEASAVGLEVLRKGGNAADAAVATAAALGVTEPYSAGIGGGGYFVYFDAATGEVTTIDGRETAPAGDACRTPSSIPRPASPIRSPPPSRRACRSGCRALSPPGRRRSTASAPSR